MILRVPRKIFIQKGKLSSVKVYWNEDYEKNEAALRCFFQSFGYVDPTMERQRLFFVAGESDTIPHTGDPKKRVIKLLK